MVRHLDQNYLPGRGAREVETSINDLGMGYDNIRFREYHGPWPAPPEYTPDEYEIDRAARRAAVARAIDLLRECGFRIEWRYNYSDTAMLVYYNNELIADAHISEWS